MTTAADDVRPVATRRPALGVSAAVLAVVVWGTSSVLIKEIDGLNGVAISTYRLWVGAVITVAAFVVSGGRVSWSLLRRSFWGAVAFSADIVFFFTALRETSVVNATIIGALQPLLLLGVAGPLFGERPQWTDALWGVIAVGGAAVVVAGGDAGGASSLEGDLLAVGALLSWSAYFVLSKSARRDLSSFEYLTGISVVSAVLIIPFPFLLSQPLGAPTAEAWWMILAVAVVNGAVGHFLMNWSHAHITLVAAALLTLGIPVVSAASAALLLDESLTALQVGGVAIVIGALAVVAVHGSRDRQRTQAAELAATAEAPEP